MQSFTLRFALAVLALAATTGLGETHRTRAGMRGKTYAVCHRASDDHSITIHVDETALAYHEGHGDYRGKCGFPDETPS